MAANTDKKSETQARVPDPRSYRVYQGRSLWQMPSVAGDRKEVSEWLKESAK